ncbi:MAG: nucleotidyltransferase domain-containing protein [Prevotellaceae bacterium]|jgi:predicted nucleotidyltransferase|nr:nucleotidyltransferase domain-containing protein [Prevotellaceae bacterium]
MKTTSEYIRLLRDYKRNHAAEYGIERMGIFGSVARNEQNENSDIDVYYEGPAMNLSGNVRLLEDLERLFGTHVDIIRKHKYLKSEFVSRLKKDLIYV